MVKDNNNNRQSQSQEQPQQQMTREEILNIALETIEENKKLTRKNAELDEELKYIKSAALGGGGLQAVIHAIHRRQEIANQNAEQQAKRINAEREELRRAEADKRYNEDMIRIEKEIPGIKPEYLKKINVVKKRTTDNIQKLNNFMDLDNEGLNAVTSTKHSIFESPTRFVFTNREYKQDNRTYTVLTCDVCLREFTNNLRLAEEHLHEGDDFDVHKKKAISGVMKEEANELSELAAKYNEEIGKAIHQMNVRDNNKARQQRYQKQAQEIKQVTNDVLINDDVAIVSNEQDLKPYPPRQGSTRA